MKPVKLILFPVLFILFCTKGIAQDGQAEVDTLIAQMQHADQDWEIFADRLAAIGEPAVAPLVEILLDVRREEGQRKKAAGVLNEIRSPAYVEPALRLVLDRKEPIAVRNQVASGLKQYNLANASNEIWKLFQVEEDAIFRSNLAGILRVSDPVLAYQAYEVLFRDGEGQCRQQALLNLVTLRPEESGEWFIAGIQSGDWSTANLAMDSLVSARSFVPGRFMRLYHRSETSETVRWRIIYILGHRPEKNYPDLLLEGLTDPAWLVHNEAALALARMPSEQVLPELRAFDQSGDQELVRRAQWVIRKLDRESGTKSDPERPSASMQPFGGYPMLQDMNRIREMLKNKCVDTITFRPGEIVADIGAGNGYLEAMLSLFNDDLTFYIQDIDSTVCNPAAIKKVVDFYGQVNGAPFTNRFVTVNGTDTDTGLPDLIFDKILMLWTYQYLKQPSAFITGLKGKLKQGGLFYVINPDQDFEYGKLLSMEFGWNGATVDKQIADIIDCGFELVSIARNHDSDEKPYVMVFKKK